MDALSGGSSVVIGAPTADPYTQAEQWIATGSTLVLFTDGLVEAPGRSLDDALEQLSATIAQHGAADSDAMCERVLSAMPAGSLRDDVALLAIRLTPNPAAVVATPLPASAHELLNDH